jgi:hypothetical protein
MCRSPMTSSSNFWLRMQMSPNKARPECACYYQHLSTTHWQNMEHCTQHPRAGDNQDQIQTRHDSVLRRLIQDTLSSAGDNLLLDHG